MGKGLIPVIAGLLGLLIGCGESQEAKIDKHIREMGDRRSNAMAREASVRILVQIGKPAVQPLIYTVKKNTNSLARANAVTALGRIGDKSAEDTVRRALEDKEPEVRASAVEAIANLAGERAISTIIGMFQDKHPTPRDTAKIMLSTKLSPTAIAPLIKCFDEQDAFVRLEAQTALAQMGNKPLPQLIEKLSDNNPEVVVLASRTLAAIGDKSALEHIKAALDRYPEGEKNYPIRKKIAGAYNDLIQK